MTMPSGSAFLVALAVLTHVKYIAANEGVNQCEGIVMRAQLRQAFGALCDGIRAV